MAFLGTHALVADALDGFSAPGNSPDSVTACRLARREQATTRQSALRHLDVACARLLQLLQPPGVLRDRGNPGSGVVAWWLAWPRSCLTCGEPGTAQWPDFILALCGDRPGGLRRGSLVGYAG